MGCGSSKPSRSYSPPPRRPTSRSGRRGEDRLTRDADSMELSELRERNYTGNLARDVIDHRVRQEQNRSERKRQDARERRDRRERQLAIVQARLEDELGDSRGRGTMADRLEIDAWRRRIADEEAELSKNEV